MCLKFLKYLLSVYHQSRGIEIPKTVRNIRLYFFNCRQWQVVTITGSESFIDTAWDSRLRPHFHICADELLYYMSFRKTRICDGYAINGIVHIWTSDNSTKCEVGLLWCSSYHTCECERLGEEVNIQWENMQNVRSIFRLNCDAAKSHKDAQASTISNETRAAS